MSADATPGTPPAEKNVDDYEVRIGGDGKVVAVKKSGHGHGHDTHGDSWFKTTAIFLITDTKGNVIGLVILLACLVWPEAVQDIAYEIGSGLVACIFVLLFILALFLLAGYLAEQGKKKWKGVAGGGDHGKKGGHH